MRYIQREFPVTQSEVDQIQETYGDLIAFQAWKLYKSNRGKDHTEEHADIMQELWMEAYKATSYQKRHRYITECFRVAHLLARDNADLERLQARWDNRTKHGAHRQKFGPEEERQLSEFIAARLPAVYHPRKDNPLTFDATFASYFKAITWNRTKTMGRKISKEQAFRGSRVSIDNYHGLF